MIGVFTCTADCDYFEPGAPWYWLGNLALDGISDLCPQCETAGHLVGAIPGNEIDALRALRPDE